MEQIKKITTRDYVASLLKKEIYCGNLKDGQELVQEMIATNLGVSRMPVREAFQILEKEGLLERMSNRHMKVVGFNIVKIKENIRILCSLETEMALINCEKNIDTTSLDINLNKYNNAIKIENKQNCANYIIEFHKKISILTDNQYLIQIHHNMCNGYLKYAFNKFSFDWKNLYKKQYDIVDSIKNKKDEMLKELYREYFIEVYECICRQYQ